MAKLTVFVSHYNLRCGIWFQISGRPRLSGGPCLGMSCQSEGLVTQITDELSRRSQI